MMSGGFHPRQRDLSLFVSGDLGWRDRLRIMLHVRACSQCAMSAEQHRAVRDGLLSQKEELPYGVDWQSLAREMRANIRVGLEAGRIVELPVEAQPEGSGTRTEGLHWRTLAVASAILLTIVSGMYLQRIHSVKQAEPFPMAVAAISMESSVEGLRVADEGSAMTLLAPAKQDLVRPRQIAGGLQTGYVDSETGQVTLHRIYADTE